MRYSPPPGLRNRHINTILGNQGPRKWITRARSRDLQASAKEVLLDCRDGIRLHGEYTPHPHSERGLAILIHGWEGCSLSTYLLSAATHLYAQGFSVFRLHLRDHGPTHHLNEQPFLAIRLDEVLDAIEQIQNRFPSEQYWLAGFSLGGNIAVRIAANMKGRDIRFEKVAAICPAIDPNATGKAVSKNLIYNGYFVRRWRNSFKKKMKFFPVHKANADVMLNSNLMSLHEAFVRRYTEHPNAASYFNAYALNEKNLHRLDAPCHIILAEDDPVIPAETAKILPQFNGLTLEMTKLGGHCGFIKDYSLRSWIDERLDALFS